ncbi:hypothetical protein [Cognatishimia activa]|uniref:Uncharacterized protein n=1 Tax=Cognatishimia activa TaxID=1715691 RepID=A0A975EMM0_9RHOB|nr:hypothetical protein [Cognatishimia activa]QTN34967.1 hypothetical protein HZ995_10735 [Cognatishimia activa]
MRSHGPAFIDQDGYVIVQAKSRARPVPFLGVFLLALGFFALKGLMIAGIGADIYAIRIQELFTSSSIVTQIGAWTMQGDAVSLMMAENIQKIL